MWRYGIERCRIAFSILSFFMERIPMSITIIVNKITQEVYQIRINNTTLFDQLPLVCSDGIETLTAVIQKGTTVCII
jgi:hypothetical protein